MTISVISTPSTPFTIPPNQALVVENLGPGYVHWGRFAVDDSHNEGIIQPSNTITFFAPFGPQIFLACDTPTSVNTSFVPFPQAAPVVGTDGTVGGSGGTPLVSTAEAYGAKGDGATDDTTAWQNAINAVSTAGGGIVRATAGATYVLNSITPKSNVTVWGYGSYFKSIGSPGNVAFFSLTSGSVSSFSVMGGTWLGTGAEPNQRQILRVDNPGTATDITIKDTYVSNWFTAPFFIANVTRVKAIDNTLVNCGGEAGKLNLIDVIDRSTTPVQQFIARGNIITGAAIYGIAYVNTGDTVDGDRYVSITDNVIQVNSTLGSGCIDIECATASIGANSLFVIADNICELASSVSGFYAIAVTGSQNVVQKMSVTGNVVKCTSTLARGIQLLGAGITATGNEITIPSGGLHAINAGTTRTITGITGDTNATTTIANVTGSQTGVQNGQMLSGTNIATGTYLVSGAGTSTWTISIAATGTTTGGTVTPQIAYSGLNIAHNVIEAGTDPSNDLVVLNQMAYSKFSDNIINCATGSSTSTVDAVHLTGCAWMQVAKNQINYSAHHAIFVSSGHGLVFEENDVYNAGEAGQTSPRGIFVSNVTGTGVNLVARNRVVDDRAVHKLAIPVDVATATNTLVDVLDNYLIGWTNTPINGTAASKRGNVYSASSALSGRATLAAGTVTVSTAEIRTGDNVLLTTVVAGGTVGHLSVGTITQGTSFVINSSSGTDTSTVYWRIDH